MQTKTYWTKTRGTKATSSGVYNYFFCRFGPNSHGSKRTTKRSCTAEMSVTQCDGTTTVVVDLKHENHDPGSVYDEMAVPLLTFHSQAFADLTVLYRNRMSRTDIEVGMLAFACFGTFCMFTAYCKSTGDPRNDAFDNLNNFNFVITYSSFFGDF